MPAKHPSIESARAEFVAGRAAAAEAACLAILQQDAAHPGALHLLGMLRFHAGQGEEGVRLLERAVHAAPGLVAAHNDLGQMLIGLSRPLEAAARLRIAVELDPVNVEAHVNLGNALHAQGELEAAEQEYRTALQLDAQHVRANLSLGNLLSQLRRPEEAVVYLSAATALAPGAAQVHQFLGNALRDLGRMDEAVASYLCAIAIEPANAEANENLGLVLTAQNRLEEALGYLRASGKHHARARALECLLRLGRPDEFFSEIQQRMEQEATNLHTASLSAFAAHQLGRRDPHPFCPQPLELVRVMDCYTRPGPDADFLRELVSEASQVSAVWEPRGVTTTRGFQTGGNLFAHGFPALARLSHDLIEELRRYRTGLLPASMTMVSRWPANMRLHGWYVRLLTGGHQYFHNHPSGWVSGCVYLQMPNSAPAGEGAIEFGLGSGDYPRLSDTPLPTLLHTPKAGPLVLFPSSLYHRTIPFQSDEERLCIAFDLLPE